MIPRYSGLFDSFVALRKESVDRNRAGFCYNSNPAVALRKESVDRNPHTSHDFPAPKCRSPQGERG